MVEEVNTLLRNWEYERLSPNYNPLTMMKRLSEILENDISKNFFDLNNLFNKWKHLLATEFYYVLLDEYIQRSLHCNRNLYDSLDLKTASVRLLLCIAYVSNIRYNNYILKTKYTSIVPSLIKWTNEAPDPLRTYATGLLDVYIKDESNMSSDNMVGDELLKCLMRRLVSNHDPSKYEHNIVWQLSPLTEVMKQFYLFRILTTWGDHVNQIPMLEESKALSVMMNCIDVSNKSRIGLMIEARSYLSKLLKIDDFALKFIDDGGVQILIKNLSQKLMYITSCCLKNLSLCERAMEHLCQTRPQVAHDLVMCVLNFFDDSSNKVRSNALMFFGFAFPYKMILDVFDANCGVQKVNRLFQEIMKNEWTEINIAFVAFKSYTQAHLILKYNELIGSTTPVTILKTTDEEVLKIIDKVLKFSPFTWPIMENLFKFKIPAQFMKIVNYRYYLHVDEHLLQCSLDILTIISLMSEAQRMLCEQVKFIANPTSGIEDILHATNSDNDNLLGLDTTHDIQKSALRVIVNCLSVPKIEGGDNSVLLKSWKKLRECNGILMLSELLNPKHQSSKQVKYLACKALCGLARDDDAKRIICKLPVYKKQHLQQLIESEKNKGSNIHAINLLKLVEPMEEKIYVDPKSSKPKNILTRLVRREIGRETIGSETDKKIKYTKFRPFPSDLVSVRKCGYKFTCLKIMPHKNHVIVCDNESTIKQFDMDNGRQKNSIQINFPCDNIDFERTGIVMLTSSPKGSALRSILNFGNTIYNLEYDKYVQFANCSQKKILASRRGFASLIDTATGTDFMRLKPRSKNNYAIYKAAYSLDDNQVLFDGVLFDGNTAENIFKFEKFNRVQNGVFHPNGYEVIINEEIWDLRTRSLIKTVPALSHKRVTFSPTDNVLYASPIKNVNSNIMYMLDASSYNIIASKEMVGIMGEFDVNKRNSLIALSAHNREGMEAVVKLYHLGLPEID